MSQSLSQCAEFRRIPDTAYNGNPVGPTLVALPKAGLLASTPVTSGETWFGVMNYSSQGHILQPAVCVDGCYAVVGQTVNGVTTFGNLTLLKAGVASYHVTGSSRTSRWGDYSATSVDPLDPMVFWTIQMYPSSHSAWSTQITQVLTGPALLAPPVLTISLAGTNVIISWPVSKANFVLQSTPTVTPTTTWTPVSQSVVTTGGVASVTLPTSNGEEFFRLLQAGLLVTR